MFARPIGAIKELFSHSALLELLEQSREADQPRELQVKVVEFVRSGAVPADLENSDLDAIHYAALAEHKDLPDAEADAVDGVRLACAVLLLVCRDTFEHAGDFSLCTLCAIVLDASFPCSSLSIAELMKFLCELDESLRRSEYTTWLQRCIMLLCARMILKAQDQITNEDETRMLSDLAQRLWNKSIETEGMLAARELGKLVRG